jgi:hypothetical protein
MKKLIPIILVLLAVVFVGQAFAEAIPSCQSSGEQAADATIVSGNAYMYGAYVITDGSNDATISVFDNTAASGTTIFEMTVLGGDNYGGKNWNPPVKCNTGITVDVTGTGASYIIEYQKR